MQLPQKFYDSLRRKPEEELARMCASITEYSEEAREAARVELTNRGLPSETLSQLLEKAKEKEAVDSARRGEPMSWSDRLVCILLPGAALLYLREFGNDGHRAKAGEAVSYLVLHFVLFTAFRWGLFRL